MARSIISSKPIYGPIPDVFEPDRRQQAFRAICVHPHSQKVAAFKLYSSSSLPRCQGTKAGKRKGLESRCKESEESWDATKRLR